MKPAIKRQEWLGVLAMGVDWSGFKMNRHQIAALALYEQPFGFTREDVEILRRCQTILSDYEEHDEEAEVRVQEIADRIEALLPSAPPTEDQ